MPLKICEKRVCGHTQGLPKFLQYPLLSQERVKLRSSNLADIFTAYMRTKAVKHLREKGAWAYPGTAQIFSVPPIISGTRRATNFKFGTYIHSVYPTKGLLKIWEKRERGCIEGRPEFFQYPLRQYPSTPANHLQDGRAGIQMSAWHGSAIPVDILRANVITRRSASPALC